MARTPTHARLPPPSFPPLILPLFSAAPWPAGRARAPFCPAAASSFSLSPCRRRTPLSCVSVRAAWYTHTHTHTRSCTHNTPPHPHTQRDHNPLMLALPHAHIHALYSAGGLRLPTRSLSLPSSGCPSQCIPLAHFFVMTMTDDDGCLSRAAASRFAGVCVLFLSRPARAAPTRIHFACAPVRGAHSQQQQRAIEARARETRELAGALRAANSCAKVKHSETGQNTRALLAFKKSKASLQGSTKSQLRQARNNPPPPLGLPFGGDSRL